MLLMDSECPNSVLDFMYFVFKRNLNRNIGQQKEDRSVGNE